MPIPVRQERLATVVPLWTLSWQGQWRWRVVQPASFSRRKAIPGPPSSPSAQSEGRSRGCSRKDTERTATPLRVVYPQVAVALGRHGYVAYGHRPDAATAPAHIFI